MQLSAILPAWDTFNSIRAVLDHLARQTIASDIEIVFVCPDKAVFQIDPAGVEAFHSYQVVEIGVIDTRSRAFAEGVRAAKSALTVFCEDHCFPVPEWAEALVARHNSATYAAVGPVFDNANPENVLSDVDLLMAYGPFLHGLPGGEARFLAGHNSCYRREILLAEDNVSAEIPPAERRTSDDSLARILEAEYVFHQRLVADGHQLYTEPRAHVFHMNFATWQSALGANFLAAKLFSAVRAQSWPASRRFIFAVAAVAVPLLRARRILPQALRAGWGWGRTLRALPALMVVLYANAIGEWLGNLQGNKTKTPNLVHYEFYRHRFSPKLKSKDIAATLRFS